MPAGRAGRGLIGNRSGLLGPSWELTEMAWVEPLAWVPDHGKSSVTIGFYWEWGWGRVVIIPILQKKKQKPTQAEQLADVNGVSRPSPHSSSLTSPWIPEGPAAPSGARPALLSPPCSSARPWSLGGIHSLSRWGRQLQVQARSPGILDLLQRGAPRDGQASPALKQDWRGGVPTAPCHCHL